MQCTVRGYNAKKGSKNQLLPVHNYVAVLQGNLALSTELIT